MKILILGSGVIGVTSAWYLARAGHAVTLVDRQPQPAMETSFANGGQVSWGAANPWAAPGIPGKALAWLFQRHAPLVLRPTLDPAMWLWLGRMLRNCTDARYLANKERQLRLARYSHACLTELRNATGLPYDQGTHGLLILYRNARDLAAATREAQLLDRLGIACRFLDRAACVAHEPALRDSQEKIAGGMLFPGDESGDCRLFTEQLAARAQRQGVKFLASTNVTRLVADGNRISRVVTDHGDLTADSYVLACGSYSPLLLKPLGIKLPVYPVKGYSITVPITHDASVPQGTLTDEAYKVVITRLGKRLRAAGTAELCGYDLTLRPARLATLAHVVRDLFPSVGNLAGAEPWAGLRPMTPDNPPVIGA
ncbi:MAG TPA: D-amino acid dehydrogenase, partial [Acidiferrobacterales bacterium]|nr:D-amino acid dehydrogenase [Acidiferrobacterales bacterium]